MPGTVWSKWYWSDWGNDPALRACSFAAQGLWMRLLVIAAEAEPVGYVTVNGRAPDYPTLARMVGGEIAEVKKLLTELEENGVFSMRERDGAIFSRRLVRDEKRRRSSSKGGKIGGQLTRDAQRGIFGTQETTQEGTQGDTQGRTRGTAQEGTQETPQDATQAPMVRYQSPEARSLESQRPTPTVDAPPPRPRAAPMRMVVGEDLVLLKRLCEAVGLDVDRALEDGGLRNVSPISRLLGAGYDLDRDVLAVLARDRGRNFRSWAYWTAAITRERDTRAGIAPAPAAKPDPTKPYSEPWWHEAVETYRKHGQWFEALYPARMPGQCPDWVLAELDAIDAKAPAAAAPWDPLAGPLAGPKNAA